MQKYCVVPDQLVAAYIAMWSDLYRLTWHFQISKYIDTIVYTY